MALDHALAACLAEGEGAVRLYRWSRPTVSFGRNEPAKAVQGSGAALDYVRRPTGGRAVLHDEELTYSLVSPLGAFGGLREAYFCINGALAEALTGLGAEVRVDRGEGGTGMPDSSNVLPLDSGPCFQSPTRGEIVADGRKLVGSAQARLEGALLQHGSILLGGDQGRLGPAGSGSVTLGELIADRGSRDVAEATASALERNLGGTWLEDRYRADEVEAAERLESNRYGRDSWTWRR